MSNTSKTKKLIGNHFLKDFNFSDKDIQKVDYVLRVILSEVSKVLVLLSISIILNVIKPFLFSTMLLILIRPFSGGLHFKKYWKCLLFTMVYYCITIFVKVNWLPVTSGGIFIMSIVVLYAFSPIASKSRPKLSTSKMKNNKCTSIILVLILACLYYLTKASVNFIIPMSLLFQSVQIIIAKGVNSHVENQKEKKSHAKNSYVTSFTCACDCDSNCQLFLLGRTGISRTGLD